METQTELPLTQSLTKSWYEVSQMVTLPAPPHPAKVQGKTVKEILKYFAPKE